MRRRSHQRTSSHSSSSTSSRSSSWARVRVALCPHSIIILTLALSVSRLSAFMCVSYAWFTLLRLLPLSSSHADARLWMSAVAGAYESRTIFDSLDLAWSLLRIFPKEQLNRISPKIIAEFYGRKARKATEDVKPPAEEKLVDDA